MDVEKAEAVVGAGSHYFAISARALKRARHARLYTQLRLAGESGVDASTISQIENGARRQVRALTLARLSEALGVAPGELLVEPEVEPGEEEAGDER